MYFLDYVDCPVDTLWPVISPRKINWPRLTRKIRLTCDPSDPADQIDLCSVWPGRSDWPVLRLTRQIRLTCGRSVTAGVHVRSGRQSGPAPAARWTAAVPVDDQRPPAAASAVWSNTATTVSHSTSIAQMLICHFVHGAAKKLTCGQIYKLTFQVISIDPACGEEHNGGTIILLNYVIQKLLMKNIFQKHVILTFDDLWCAHCWSDCQSEDTGW